MAEAAERNSGGLSRGCCLLEEEVGKLESAWSGNRTPSTSLLAPTHPHGQWRQGPGAGWVREGLYHQALAGPRAMYAWRGRQAWDLASLH